MQTYRESTAQEILFRKGRFSQRGGEWFLTTRENTELGPFESHAAAAVYLDEYLLIVDGADNVELKQFCKIFAAA